MYIVIICLLLSSCTLIRVKPKHKGINPELESYVEEFIYASNGKITEEHLNHLSMEITDVRTSKYFAYSAGVCWWTLSGHREIELNWGSWIWRSDKGRMSLVFHELGHCLCHRLHSMSIHYPTEWYEKLWNSINNGLQTIGVFESYEFYPDGCPQSLMYPQVVPDYCIELHYNDYVKEMFANCEP